MIINATNIGTGLSGIGRYSLALSRYFLDNWYGDYRIVINISARKQLEKYAGAGRLQLVSDALSPDRGFRGHLMRLTWSNRRRLQKEPLFNTSQMEAGLYHKRQIITVHDLIPLMCPQWHRKQYPFFRYYLPKVLKNAVKIITVSNFTKAMIVEHYGIAEEKIDVIYNGAWYGTPKDVVRASGDYLLYVGRLAPTKNVVRMLRAFAYLVDGNALDIRIKMTGRRSDIDWRGLGISDRAVGRIDFCGTVTDKELEELYRGARALVFPSLYEGFGLPPLEAMVFGCPVVASKAASIPEVCGDAVYYVDPNDCESIADGILRVVGDEELRSKLVNLGNKRAKQFTWEASGAMHRRLLQEVTDSFPR